MSSSSPSLPPPPLKHLPPLTNPPSITTSTTTPPPQPTTLSPSNGVGTAHPFQVFSDGSGPAVDLSSAPTTTTTMPNGPSQTEPEPQTPVAAETPTPDTQTQTQTQPSASDDAFASETFPPPVHTIGSSSSGSTAPMIARPRAKRSSVFSGRPDELHSPSPVGSAEPVDADEDEDEEVGKSIFNRQRSIITYQASTHRLELLIATFNVLVHVGTILTDLLLLADYSENGQDISATAIAVIRIIVGLVEVEFDYLHRGWKNGRWMLIPVIFCNLRCVIDYVRYVRDWHKFRNREWANSDFRASVSFETFIGSLPSLIVQTYVIIVDERPMQQVWTVAFVMTCLSSSVDLLHHFKYVRTDVNIYCAQFVKALVTTGLRTVLVAILLDVIGRVLMAWMVVSFLIGCGMYYLAYRYARKHDRDNPFEYGGFILHASFGGLIAGTVLFVSIPFAPSHSIYDWWLGYLMAEAKMTIENFIMLAIVLANIKNDYAEDLFYSVLIFTLICYIGTICACYFIHQHVRKQLHERDLYSDTAIVKLFASFGKYYLQTYHPNSVETLGTSQDAFKYTDHTGKAVHDGFEQQHQLALQRTATANANKKQAIEQEKKTKNNRKNRAIAVAIDEEQVEDGQHQNRIGSVGIGLGGSTHTEETTYAMRS